MLPQNHTFAPEQIHIKNFSTYIKKKKNKRKKKIYLW